MKKPYTFIVLEGGDGSGKATQTTLLKEKLEQEGHSVATFSFPRYYSSMAGKLIGELLAGKHGDFMTMSPYVSALPYALDRAGARKDIMQKIEEGYVILCDRYTPSSLAHQTAKVPKDEQDAFIEFIETLEYEELEIVKPTRVLYLSVPTDIASDLISQKDERGYLADDGSSRDMAERNINHQDRTRLVYMKLASERKDWIAIECIEDGEMRTREAIHADVWESVVKDLKK